MISKIASKYLEFLTSNRLHKIASSYLDKQATDPTYYKDREDYIKNGKSGWSMGALDSPQAQNYRAVDYDEWLSNGGVHKPIPKGDAPAQTSQPSSPVQQTQPQPVVQPQVPVNTGKTETQMRFENAIKAKEIDDVNRNATNIVNNYEDLASKMPKTKGGSAPVQTPQPQPEATAGAAAAPIQTPVQPQESTAPAVPTGVGVNSTQTAPNSGQQSAVRKSMSDYKDRADFIKNGTEGNTLGDVRGRLYREKLWNYRQMANSVRQAAEDNNIDISNGFEGNIENGKVTNINGQTIR